MHTHTHTHARTHACTHYDVHATHINTDICMRTLRLQRPTSQVGVLMGTLSMGLFAALLLLGRYQLGQLFTGDEAVILLTAQVCARGCFVMCVMYGGQP